MINQIHIKLLRKELNKPDKNTNYIKILTKNIEELLKQK
jgi:hypothetical protein